jgi:SAM-dependent methyltransferase
VRDLLASQRRALRRHRAHEVNHAHRDTLAHARVAHRQEPDAADAAEANVRARNLYRLATAPFRERGFRETLRSVRATIRAARTEQSDAFDREHGTDTGKTFAASDLDARGADVPALWRYWPTQRASFERVMASLDVPCERYVFVDLGSGKGRALLMAAEYPFLRVVGVELSPALHRVAERNVRAYHSPRQWCKTFELVCQDAAEFVPPPENLVVYMFQPFPRETMRAVVENLGRSLDSAPRDVLIAYLNPIFDDVITASGRFVLVARAPGRGPGEFDHAVYRATRPREGEGRAR